MRIQVGTVVCLLLVLGPAAAEDAPKDPTTKAADAVEAAYERGDAERLRVYAGSDAPDPWTVADRLAIRGAFDAALAFAQAVERADTEHLAAYLEGRRESGHLPALRAAVDVARAAATEADQQAALSALNEYVAEGDGFEQALLEASRGNLLNRLERSTEAVEAYLSAGREAERVGWLALAAKVYFVAGHAAYDRLDYDSLLASWGRLEAVEEKRGNEAGAAKAQMFVGGVLIELGDTELATRMIETALARFIALGDDDSVAWTLNNLSIAYERRGDYPRALAALERTIELAEKVGNQYRVACAKVDLGSTHSTMGAQDHALELYEEARRLFEDMGDAEGLAQCRGNLGILYGYLGEYDKAIPELEAALKEFKRLEIPLLSCSGLVSLAWALRLKGDLERARGLAEEGVVLARKIHHPWSEAHALQCLVEVLLDMGELDLAEEHLAENLRVAAVIDSSELQMIAYVDRARLWLARGDHARAVRSAGRSLDHSLELLAGFSRPEGAMAREQFSRVFEVAVRAAAGLGKPRAMFAAMESARAGAFLEALKNREAIRSASVSDRLLTLERDARKRMTVAAHRLQQATGTDSRKEIREHRRALDRARDELERVISQIQRASRKAAELLYPAPASLEEAQGALAKGDAFVIYSLISEQALALVVTRNSARIVALGESAAIDAAARLSLDDPAVDASKEIAALRKAIVEPLRLSADTKRLLISPDGVLGYVPFALIERERTIAYVPSATAYRVLTRDRGERGHAVLAVGDPNYGKVSTGLPVLAQRGELRLVPLPATRDEASAVGDVILLGAQATPTRFFEAVADRKRWHAVHLACHALVDRLRPTRSALALALEKDGSHLLTSADIFGRRIPADLVVLSACETAKGRLYRTEGIVGLTRSFMLAGTSRVVVSLWKVDDEATKALMVEFYRLWNPKGEGAAKALSAGEALRRAQAFVRSHEQWAHPYYWAAWVLWGLPD